MTKEDYRTWMIEMLHKYGHDELIAMMVQYGEEKLLADRLKEQETVEHACEILRSNGWTETEPICSECDAIHVVRCKECGKRNTSDCPLHYGGHSENDTDDDWFCADGGKGAEK